jgi:transposase
MAKIVFKTLSSNQSVLFPSNLLERIPAHHPVLIVNQIVDRLNIDCLLSKYKGGGTSAYHPRMLLKVLFYAYLSNLYSCRKIAKALQENIYFMWLSGDSTPDFRTINRFRGEHLKDDIKTLFTQIVLLLQEAGYLSLDVQYIDGTKIESASNRYTFVWRGSVEKNKLKLEAKIRSVLSLADSHIEEDRQAEKFEDSPKAIDSDLLRRKVNELNSRLDKMDKIERKQVRQLQEDYLPRLEKYEDQLEKLGERNSYSNTDEDATFMRMKEDHMKNGQLKPAYNIQIATEEQFVTNIGIYRRAGDTATLPSFLEDFENSYHKQSATVVADAGYGSEQNYEWMEDNHIEAYVKYNFFHKEQKRAWKKNPFEVQNLFYNKNKDFFICPMGQKLMNIGTKKNKSDLGYISTVTRYQAQNCQGCPLRGLCHKAKGNRIMEVNYKLMEYKRKARERLMSQPGIYHRGKRCIEPEAVFGQIKHNSQFNRFRLRGLQKVNIEFTLVAIAHNLRKWAKKAGLSWLFSKIMRFYSKNRENQNIADIKSINLITATAA